MRNLSIMIGKAIKRGCRGQSSTYKRGSGAKPHFGITEGFQQLSYPKIPRGPRRIHLDQGWANFSVQGPHSKIHNFIGPHSILTKIIDI